MRNKISKLLISLLCILALMPITPVSATGEEVSSRPVITGYRITSGSAKRGEPFNVEITILDVGIRHSNFVDFGANPNFTNSFVAMTNNGFATTNRVGEVKSITKNPDNDFIIYTVEFKNLVYQGDDKTLSFDFGFDFDFQNEEGTDVVLGRAIRQSGTITITEAFSPAEPPAPAPSSAKLVSSNVGFSGDRVGGGEFSVGLNVRNAGNGTASRVSVSISSDDPKVTLVSSVNTQFLGNIGVGATSSRVSFNMTATKDIVPGPVTFTVNVTYTNSDGTGGSESFVLSTRITQEDRVSIRRAEIFNPLAGVETEVDYSIINNGLTTLYNGEVQLLTKEGEILSTAFVGNVESGKEYANADLLVTFTETGEHTVVFVFMFENAEGQKARVKEEITVTVNEWIPPIIDPMPMPPINQPGGLSWIWYVIGAGVVGTASFVGFKAYKKKKAKVEESGDEDEDF